MSKQNATTVHGKTKRTLQKAKCEILHCVRDVKRSLSLTKIDSLYVKR